MKRQIWRFGSVVMVAALVGLGLAADNKADDPAKAGGASPAPAPAAADNAQPAPAPSAPAPASPADKGQAPDKFAPAGPPAPADKPTADQPAKAGQPVPPEKAGSEAAPPPKLVQPATPPAHLALSEGLAELLKLVQAGVNEAVLLAYITNSTNVFDLNADAIVYLNDLGVPPTVVTTLIQHDASPEILARKRAAVAVTPLPPELKLTKPATNIYPTTAPPPAGDEVPGNFGFYTEPVAAPVPEPVPVNPTNQTATVTQAVTYVTQQVTSVTYFYEALAPYGNWVSVPEYGLCWQPTVAVVDLSWRPYHTHGRWLWTDAGWYWYSHYSWGWAPFHYGRWAVYPGYGWLWVPDTYWGPSWVTWRYTPYYSGWAPLPPRCHYVSGFGLYYQGGSVGLSFGFGFDWDYYTFMPTAYFCHPHPHHYYVPRHQAKTVYKDSVVINNYIHGDNNTIINHGIGLDRVSKVHRGDIPRATVREAAFSRARDARLERLEQRDSGLTVVRPRLPERPPISPAALAARAQTEVGRNRTIHEPVRAGQPASAPRAESRAGASTLSAPRPTASPSPTAAPTRPEVRAAAPAPRGAPGPEAPKPTRAQPTPTTPAAPGAAPSAAAARTQSKPVVEVVGKPATTPARQPTAPTAPKAGPDRPTRPVPATAVPGSGAAGVAPAPRTTTPVPAPTPVRPQRTEPRAGASSFTRSENLFNSRSAVAVPTPSRGLLGDSFYNGRPVSGAPGFPPAAAPPSVGRSAPSAPPSVSVPVPSLRSEPSRPAARVPGPSMSAPSMSAPAPRSAPAPSTGSGSGGRSVGRPSRPDR